MCHSSLSNLSLLGQDRSRERPKAFSPSYSAATNRPFLSTALRVLRKGLMW